jgi:hypothetical protein
MAGQADRRSANRTDSSDRRAVSGRSRLGRKPSRLVAVPMGPETNPGTWPYEQTAVSAAGPLPPDVLPRSIGTQASYRFLVSSGLTGPEAAGLIGYVVGLPTGSGRWSLDQVNELVFLRNLYTGTPWGDYESRPIRPDPGTGHRP